MEDNAFGQLVKSFREQHRWSQEELAERWGHSRVYISQIERGKRKLESMVQLSRLADVLDIPREKLVEVGRCAPQANVPTRQSQEATSAMLQTLLPPSRNMVQLTYLLWLANEAVSLDETLQTLNANLDHALHAYSGEFLKPAQQLLAYTHHMRGRMALDHLDLSTASSHYSTMIGLGEDLHDPDIIALGMIYQGSLFRERRHLETALQCFEAAKPFAQDALEAVRGLYYVNLSTVHANTGQETLFLQAIDAALEIAQKRKKSLVGLANDFSLEEVLWAQACGFSELWKPEKALTLFEEVNKLRPFRPFRKEGAYIINKGEAYLRMGDLDQGIPLTLEGMKFACEYHSQRHIGWIEKIYHHLRLLPVGKNKQLNILGEALREAHVKQETW